MLVRKALDTMRAPAEARGIRLEMLGPEELVTVLTNPTEFQQVVLNLVSNALKFTPKGGIVRVRVASDRSNLSVEIEDSGIGINQEALPRVFDPFFAVSTVAGKAGIGLGLAVVKDIVVKCGGKITVKSEGEGSRGAVFHFTLPPG